MSRLKKRESDHSAGESDSTSGKTIRYRLAQLQVIIIVSFFLKQLYPLSNPDYPDKNFDYHDFY